MLNYTAFEIIINSICTQFVCCCWHICSNLVRTPDLVTYLFERLYPRIFPLYRSVQYTFHHSAIYSSLWMVFPFLFSTCILDKRYIFRKYTFVLLSITRFYLIRIVLMSLLLLRLYSVVLPDSWLRIQFNFNREWIEVDIWEFFMGIFHWITLVPMFTLTNNTVLLEHW